jgi:hypothetical protein
VLADREFVAEKENTVLMDMDSMAPVVARFV